MSFSTIGAYGMLLVLVGLLVTSIVLPIAVTDNNGPVPAPQGFGTGTANYKYIERVCLEQKNIEWDLATNERQLSNQYFNQLSNEYDPRNLNVLAIFWGQFIDHDIVLTKSDTNSILTITDGLFSINVTRTIKDPVTKESKNFLSPMIDLSTVYGDYLNPDKLVYLKEATRCELKTSAGDLLPLNEAGTEYLAGDERATEQVGLTALHTLFMREHNRLCAELRNFNMGWTETQLFWKARQINIEYVRKITFTEWLPLLFGSQRNLLISTQNTPIGQSSRIVDAFSAAAYRFGHSMVSDTIGTEALGDLFFDVTDLRNKGVDHYIKASIETRAQKCDTKVVNGLRNIMFGAEDLVARNLFRSREMDLPTYPQLAECYGTTPTNSFDDPLLGLLSEPLVEGSSLPRTIAVIVAEQFRRLRDSWTSPELGPYYRQQVGYVTLSRIINRNTNLNVKNEAFIR